MHAWRCFNLDQHSQYKAWQANRGCTCVQQCSPLAGWRALLVQQHCCHHRRAQAQPRRGRTSSSQAGRHLSFTLFPHRLLPPHPPLVLVRYVAAGAEHCESQAVDCQINTPATSAVPGRCDCASATVSLSATLLSLGLAAAPRQRNHQLDARVMYSAGSKQHNPTKAGLGALQCIAWEAGGADAVYRVHKLSTMWTTA